MSNASTLVTGFSLVQDDNDRDARSYVSYGTYDEQAVGAMMQARSIWTTLQLTGDLEGELPQLDACEEEA